MSYVPDGALPTGHLPTGHIPEAGSTPPAGYPAVRSSIVLPGAGIWVIDPDAPEFCEIVWDALLPNGVTLASVAYTLPSPLVELSAVVEQTLGKSAVKVGGAAHGMLRHVQAVATLSDGSTLQCTAPLRCFNG